MLSMLSWPGVIPVVIQNAALLLYCEHASGCLRVVDTGNCTDGPGSNLVKESVANQEWPVYCEVGRRLEHERTPTTQPRRASNRGAT